MIQDIAAVATAVGVLVAAVGLLLTRNVRQHEFEDFFIHRYWTLMDKLSDDLLAERAVARTDEKDLRVIRQYIGLCEDELELYRDRWISRRTGRLWARSAYQQLRSEPFRHAWREIEHENDGVRQQRYGHVRYLLALEQKDQRWKVLLRRRPLWQRKPLPTPKLEHASDVRPPGD